MTPPPRPPIDRAEEIAQAWHREQPGLPVESIGIITRIGQAAKLLADERRHALAAVHMDAATLDLLSTLRRAGPPYRLTTRELAARCLITAGAVTQRVDRALVEHLVRRLPAEPGTRTVSVELTPKGHRTVEHAVDGLLNYEQAIIEILTTQERQDLARLMATLIQGLTDRQTRARPASPTD